MIQFRCACGKLLQVADDQAGVRAACPACAAVSTVPGAAAPRPLPVLHPELPPPPRRRRRRVALSALFLAALAAGGVYLGWRHGGDEARARRALEAGLSRHHNISAQSIELRPLPAEEGGGPGQFTGTVLDDDGHEWALLRVRVRNGQVGWRLSEPEARLREWVTEHVEKKLEAKVKAFEVRRGPDGRWQGQVTTTTGLVLNVAEGPITDESGNLQSGATTLELAPASLTRLWEQRVLKRYSHLKQVALKQDSEGSWSGEGRDGAGRRYNVSVKAMPQEPGKDRQYSLQVFPAEGE